MRLDELMGALKLHDEGISELSDDDLEMSIGDIKDKIDVIGDLLSRLDSEAKRLKGRADEITKGRLVVENGIKRLKGYVAHSMHNSGFEKFPGEFYNVALQSKKMFKPKITNDNLTTKDFLALAEIDPNLVSSAGYKWDSKILNKTAKINETFCSKWTEKVETEFIVFRVRNISKKG